MNRKGEFEEAVRYYLRYLLQIPSVYRPSGKPHIFLFSTRRSGSTLLRDIICSQPGFNYIDQPYDVWQFNPHARALPHVKMGQYVSLTDREKDNLKDYTRRILEREYIIRSQWQLWNKFYHWHWERYVVKILNVKALINWFQEQFASDIRIIYLVRHPIPTALSIMQRKSWGITAEAYLQNEVFAKEYLTDRLVGQAYEILKTGSVLEKHVLNWCLENLVPLRCWQERDWLTISYERLTSQPGKTIERLSHQLDLFDPEAMLGILNKPTRTTVRKSKEAIISDGPKSRLESWRNKVDEEMMEKVDNILRLFEIDVYEAFEVFPCVEFDAC